MHTSITSNTQAIIMSRRDVLTSGAALAATPLAVGVATATKAQPELQIDSTKAMTARAYGNSASDAQLLQIEVKRRAVGPHDVLLDVLYCGICHSDIHQARNEWKDWGPTTYPCVPGHEIIGRVVAVGSKVTKFKLGDIGGVGCLVDSCRVCDNCQTDREQNCTQEATYTYNSPVKDGSGPTSYGGYSDKITVTEHFVIRIPPGMDLAATAPLLCAGVTTFSPMQHWKVAKGQSVGIIGLGGLGHVALKLAVARGAKVTVFTTSPDKIPDAKRMGAHEAVLSSDQAAMKRLANTFDLLISTVPKAYPMKAFITVLKQDGTLVNVGAMEALEGVTGNSLVMGRKRIAGSLIGSIAETQAVIDYCAARNIMAEIELIGVKDINQAFDRVVKKDIRYRFVIDMTSLKA